MGRACHTRTQFVDQQADRGRIACQVVVERLTAEVAGTTQADDARSHNRGVVAGAVEAILSSLTEGGKRHTVVFRISTTEDDAGSVIEPYVRSTNLWDGLFADDMIGWL